jgi:uncharacterized membrane protein YphA (DoxX/SURF4 family)
MNGIEAFGAMLAAEARPWFVLPAIRWLAMLLLCGAYLQGALTKAFDFSSAIAEMEQFRLKPAAPFAVVVIIFEIGASSLILGGWFRWAGALALAVFTLMATVMANPFWEAPRPKRYATENSFFEHLGLVGGFLLVAWYDLHG